MQYKQTRKPAEELANRLVMHDHSRPRVGHQERATRVPISRRPPVSCTLPAFQTIKTTYRIDENESHTPSSTFIANIISLAISHPSRLSDESGEAHELANEARQLLLWGSTLKRNGIQFLLELSLWDRHDSQPRTSETFLVAARQATAL